MTPRPLDPADRYQRRHGDGPPARAEAAAALGVRAASHAARRLKARGSRPNAGLEALYRQRLDSLVGEMNASVLYWLRSAYRNNPPEMTQDGSTLDDNDVVGGIGDRHDGGVWMAGGKEILAMDRSPADILKTAFDSLAQRWLRRFDDAADRLANWFAKSTADRSDAQLAQILRRSGFSVRFVMTPAMRDIVDATVHENVSLIRSIPQQYLTSVEGIVMRSVTAGRDLETLTTDLREQHGVTKRRARFIALDQNNKATSAFTRARQVEHGLQAIWMHSHAGKTPRPTHIANNGEAYNPEKGWWDPAVRRFIWPGTEPNCRCFSKTIIPGFK